MDRGDDKEGDGGDLGNNYGLANPIVKNDQQSEPVTFKIRKERNVKWGNNLEICTPEEIIISENLAEIAAQGVESRPNYFLEYIPESLLEEVEQITYIL